ncbi:MAG: penicillin-binding protein activator [Gallionella sp.]
MQRLLLLLSTLFALYACAPTLPHKPSEEKRAAPTLAAPTTEVEKPAPVTAIIEMPAPVVVTPEITEPPMIAEPGSVPHIALLLPLQSSSFGSAASAVQQGFMAAARLEGQTLPIRTYGNFDENSSVVTVYRQAIANGARAVVGPLTRSGVAALAAVQNIPVPTLSLNMVESTPAQNMYFFGMAVETEARQIAQLARQHELHQAIIVTTRDQLSKRLQAAFEDEWNAAGGTILREIEYGEEAAIFADITEIPGTVVFVAADANKARLIRPYLSNRLPIYATSRVFAGNTDTLINYDLNEIHFVDMPWLLQADHPAVMVYPRASPPLSIDEERLYALGIDAYRLIHLLLTNRLAYSLPLDGVSGQIRLNGHIFQRIATPAVFVQGQAQLANAPVLPAIQMFPEQPVGNP